MNQRPRSRLTTGLLIASMAFATAIWLPACDDGPFEEAGEEIEDGADEIGDALD